MEQMTLFDTGEKLARRQDPETSKCAARELNAKLPKVQHALFVVFSRSLSSLTANEAAEIATKGTKDITVSQDTFRKRCHELERKNLIESIGKRMCTITGKSAQHYKVIK